MTSPERRALLEQLADRIANLPREHIRRVGIDGVDGAGKTCFAAELEAVLSDRGEHVIRASVDGFHHPRAIRYRQGRFSPAGFFLDSFDYDQLRSALLDPLSPGGSRRFRTAVHDVASDQPVSVAEESAGDDDVLVVDGLFLHRPELRHYWDLSVFLDVPVEVSVARMATRDGTAPDPGAASNRRYVEGQARYLAECRPTTLATVVIDNTDLDHPLIREPGRER